MRNTLDYSLKTYGHPDIIIRSTYGLDYEDQMLIKSDDKIKDMTMVKTADLMNEETLIRLKAINKSIPKSIITEGRMPSKKNEIALDKGLRDKYKIGDKVKFSYIKNQRFDEEVMKNLDYELVGFFQTSDYFMEDMRELSFSAKKELNGYAYVLEENFDTDKYGEANIIYKDTKDMDKSSKDYENLVESRKEDLEDKFRNRPREVLTKLKKDTNKELDDAQEEIDNAKSELSDGEKKLAKARKDLDKGYLDYKNGKKTYEDKITQGERELIRARNDLISGEDQLKKGREEYQKNLNTFNQEIKEAEENLKVEENQLIKAKEEIEIGQNQLDQAYQKLESEFEPKRNELVSAKEKLDQMEIIIRQKEIEIENFENSLEKSDNQITNNSSPLNFNLNEKKAELESLKAQYQTNLTEYQKNKDLFDQKYNTEKEKIDQGQLDLNKKKDEINQGLEKINAGKNELETKRQSGQGRLDAALKEINSNQREIDQGWTSYNAGIKSLENNRTKGKKDLEDSYQKLLDGEKEYQENLEKFNKEKKDADKKIEDGQDDITDGKDTLARLVDPEYSIETIYDNEGISTYHQNSLNMDELSKVFPTFFYLVAMLVTLTTMKRFIEEQRTINGSLKALGYSNKQISQRFYIYGMVPTLIGSIIGVLLGRFVVAKVIILAYSTGFNSLKTQYVNPLPYMIFTIILSLGLIALTVFLSSKETINESAASLLRPKAPNIGKKILLERFTLLWKKLSFLQKITARNLFRYKSRMFMTLFGVGGCTALTFFGFAMIGSIKDTVNIQQKEINHYDVISIIDTNAKDEDKKSYYDKIKNLSSLDIDYRDIKVKADNNIRKISLVISEDSDSFKDFVSLRTPKGDPINLEDEYGVMTEKAGEKLNIKPGDSIKFKYENKEFDLKITNISENYSGDYIYISKDKFKEIAGIDPKINANYLKGDAKGIIEDLEDQSAVNAIINTSVVYQSMDVLLANLNLVIGIITIISILLALVVLYNLININVSERKRELATIKVLGFYPKEVTSYIFREIFLLTFIGIFIGYALGYVMFRYIIYVVAPEKILLSYNTHLTSYVYSGLITLFISIVLLLIVHNKLKKIDMAEAMSSGE